MSEPRFPSPETTQRLLGNLRRTRLEMRDVNLQLEEIIADFDRDIRQQKLRHGCGQK